MALRVRKAMKKKPIPQKSPKARSYLAELYENARPGCCIVCDGKLPARKKGASGRNRVVHAGECAHTYRKLWWSSRNASALGKWHRAVWLVTSAWKRVADKVTALEKKL